MKVYKYRQVDERISDILLNHRIFFPTVSHLNDPCEFLHTFKIGDEFWSEEFMRAHDAIASETRAMLMSAQEEIDAAQAQWWLQYPGLPFPSELAAREAEAEVLAKLPCDEAVRLFVLMRGEDVVQGYLSRADAEARIHEMLASIGILCFSKRRESPLMWAHYAKSHTGVVLEFDISKDPVLRAALPVKYSKGRPRITVDNPLGPLFCKSVDWKYEREYRILSRPGGKPYEFSPAALTGIIFGCKTTQEHKRWLRQLVDQSERPLKFYTAGTRADAYSLSIESI